jgi:hypothetical protein
MKITALLLCFTCLLSCSVSLKLALPTVFKEQSTMLHVNGARKNTMSFGNFTSSKIKRGLHITYPGYGRGFLLQNLLFNHFGLQKEELIKNEKARFKFSLSDEKTSVDVFAEETQVTRNFHYQIGESNNIFQNYDRLQEYRYVFSAVIGNAGLSGGKNWEMLMTNIYDRRKDTVNSIFTLVKPDDSGLATNGQDTIFIKALIIQKTESTNGKTGWLPVKLVSGYELSTSDGVVAVVDVIDKNIWFYNELDNDTRLTAAAIATAIFARRVNDVKW